MVLHYGFVPSVPFSLPCAFYLTTLHNTLPWVGSTCGSWFYCISLFRYGGHYYPWLHLGSSCLTYCYLPPTTLYAVVLCYLQSPPALPTYGFYPPNLLPLPALTQPWDTHLPPPACLIHPASLIQGFIISGLRCLPLPSSEFCTIILPTWVLP